MHHGNMHKLDTYDLIHYLRKPCREGFRMIDACLLRIIYYGVPKQGNIALGRTITGFLDPSNAVTNSMDAKEKKQSSKIIIISIP